MGTTQVNKYKIIFSKIYMKYQVKRNKVCLEEFAEVEDAIRWAKNN